MHAEKYSNQITVYISNKIHFKLSRKLDDSLYENRRDASPLTGMKATYKMKIEITFETRN
jgi:hypothetical protein